MPSDSSTIAAGGRRSPPLERFERGGEAVAGGRAAVGGQAGERRAHLLVVGGRRLEHARAVAERDRADAQLVGRLVEEAVGGRARGVEPVGRDVGGGHRARGVGDEHDRGLLDGHRHGRLRARERDDEAGDREREQRARDVAPPARGGRRGQGGDGRAREADGVPATATLGEQVQRDARRDGEQAEQEERGGEAHSPASGPGFRVGAALPRAALSARSSPRPSSRSQSWLVSSTMWSARAARRPAATASRRSASSAA